ncbi:hypothetical protein V8E54_007660 [Elaphomyces granulatus]
MPPPLVQPTEQERQLQCLATAFDALLHVAQFLSRKEQDLQRRVKFAYEEYLKLAHRITGGSGLNEDSVSQKILRGDSELNSSVDRPSTRLDLINTLRSAGQLEHQTLEDIVAGLDCYRSILGPEGSEDNDFHISSNPCLIAARARGSTALEHDFTTNGVKGTLRCPFAKSNDLPISPIKNDSATTLNDICGHEDLDPIKAELNQDIHSNNARSAKSAPRCPIRYLDQHSPEEMAQYFQNHKHEIPRSHAICVKRYQKNSESLRQIDAKYGSLVNMLQGLGQKHRPYLPASGRNRTSTYTSVSAERVDKWAKDVSSQSLEPAPALTRENNNNQDTDRSGRFERPLREVRVGESPSRPWGIPVPVPLPEPLPQSVNLPESKRPAFSNHGSIPTTVRSTARCPFTSSKEPVLRSEPLPSNPQKSHDAEGATPKAETSKDPTSPPGGINPMLLSSAAKIVINGPVLFGYSAEQAIQLIQQLGSPECT